jgi:predicted transcriptional regulator
MRRKPRVKVDDQLVQKVRILLDAGQNQYQVAIALKISQATVSRIAKKLAAESKTRVLQT